MRQAERSGGRQGQSGRKEEGPSLSLLGPALATFISKRHWFIYSLIIQVTKRPFLLPLWIEPSREGTFENIFLGKHWWCSHFSKQIRVHSGSCLNFAKNYAIVVCRKILSEPYMAKDIHYCLWQGLLGYHMLGNQRNGQAPIFNSGF